MSHRRREPGNGVSPTLLPLTADPRSRGERRQKSSAGGLPPPPDPEGWRRGTSTTKLGRPVRQMIENPGLVRMIQKRHRRERDNLDVGQP